MAKAPWPITGKRLGIEVVTIPRAEYESLLQRSLKASADAVSQTGKRRPTSRFFRDRDLALFVDSCLDRHLIFSDIRTECIDRFGAARAPSVSSLCRYSQARR